MGKTIQELKAERKALDERNKSIYATVEKEKRAITDEELAEVSANTMKRAQLADEIIERMAELNGGKKPAKRSVDYVKAINEALHTNTRTFAVGVEQRAALTTANGAGVIATEVYDIMDAIRDNLVLTRAGATMLTGLEGDLKLPMLGASTAAWGEENGEATDGAGTITSVSMSPKRLTCYVDLSNKLLEQSSQDINSLIQRDIVNAVSAAIQSAVLGNAAATTTKPGGIFKGAGTAAALAFKNIVDLETTVATNNSLTDGAKYIMHPKAYGLCKTTAKAEYTGLGMIADADGRVNGYETLRTNAVYNDSSTTSYGVAFGDFSEVFIGSWGNISVTVDPYTQATKGITRLVLNAYCDAVVRNTKAIAVAMVK